MPEAGSSSARVGAPGRALSTWTMVYRTDRKEVRESTGTDNFDDAQKILRSRLTALDEGSYVGPARDRLTVGDLLTGLLDFYTVQGHRSLPSVTAQVKPLRQALGTGRALDLSTARVRRLTREWQAATVTNATINRRLSLLRRAYALGKIVLDPAKLDSLTSSSPSRARWGSIWPPTPSPRFTTTCLTTLGTSSNSPTSAAPARASSPAPPGRTGTRRRGSSPGRRPR